MQVNAAQEAANDADIIQTDVGSVWHHMTQHRQFDQVEPMVVVSGKGLRITDANGREYLDATSGGVWTVNVGYGRTEIADAVRDQLVEMCYWAQAGGNIPGARFAERLLEKLPGMGKVYFSNSGSEANEKGYKMIRQLAHLEGDGSKHKIIYRDRDYHGTTLGALSTTGHEQRTAQYGPYPPGFAQISHACCYRCPFGKTYGSCDIECARDLETVILREGPETVGGVVLEPITAGGGIIPPVPEYFPIIEEICEKYDVLLQIDEVVCGLGRTGEWFGHQHYGVKPDIVTMAKGVASGYAAISCTVTTNALYDRFRANPDDPLAYFRDISTFGGCTSGPTAGLVNLDIIERENLLQNVRDRGEQLMDGLHVLKDKHSVVGDVRGKGLFVGLELVADRETKEPLHESQLATVVGAANREGVLIGRSNRSFPTLNNNLCLSPALIATTDDIDEILHAVDVGLTSLSAS